MPRADVNTLLLSRDPLMKFISTDAMPRTHFRPSDADYPQVSALLRQATADVIGGESAETAAANYAAALTGIVGKSHVFNN
jgi:multiple sugar transport system substrate-binding protein